MKITFTEKQIIKIFGKRVRDYSCSFRCRVCSSPIWMMGNGEKDPKTVTCPTCGKDTINIFSKEGISTLQKLIDEKIVWIENGDYVGKASDGVIVSLGYDEKSTVEYLKHHPTPDKW